MARRDIADRTPQMHNRIFVLGAKDASEQEFRECFSKYGSVSNVWTVKDRNTGDHKGITYVTFNKTSEAVLAQEEMNGRVMPGHPKPLKVVLAAEKEQGNMREDNEQEKLLRIFIKVPRTHTEGVIQDYFKQWGEIDYCHILRDKVSGDSKGLAYVKFYRAYCAALALENADPEYKAVFAQKKQYANFRMVEYRGEGGGPPPGRGSAPREDFGSRGGGGYGGRYAVDPMDLVTETPHSDGGETRLEAMVSTAASPEQVYRLFDIAPGLDYCDFDRRSGVAYVQYTHPSCAAYAREKLNAFEYPPGFRISVRYPPNQASYSGYTSYNGERGGGRYSLGGDGGGSRSWSGAKSSNGGGSGGGGGGSETGGEVRRITETLSQLASAPSVQDDELLQTLVQTMSKATSVLEARGIGGSGSGGGGSSSSGAGPSSTPGSADHLLRTNYCSVPLPERKPCAPKESEVMERLFVVSKPKAFPDFILRDAFCRFGDLIDAHFMSGRNYGYAKYVSHDAAQRALDALHEAEMCGNVLKVLFADPPKDDDSSKRPKMGTP